VVRDLVRMGRPNQALIVSDADRVQLSSMVRSQSMAHWLVRRGRLGSPTFGKWTAVILSAENKRQIFVPRGFAHGFAVRSDSAEFLYKCDEFYRPEDEYGVLWNDPALGIPWELSGLTPFSIPFVS
jgi:dTDP-4-dehydrorhamnose 3,5-epimerase-like enzyme